MGQFDEKDSECCDCGLDKFETSDHVLFECPKYDHLRLGWRWSQVSQEIKSFLLKTRRFDDKLKNGKEGLEKMNEDGKKTNEDKKKKSCLY